MSAHLEDLPSPGSQLGEYSLGAVVMSTLLGTVYRVEGHPQVRSLMLMPPALVAIDARYFQRYREQVEGLRLIAHSSLLLPCGFLEEDGYKAALYAEAIEHSLGKYIHDNGPMDPEPVSALLQHISVGLASVTRKAVGHHFLIPDYIVQTAAGDIGLLGVGLFQCVKYAAFENYISATIEPIEHGDAWEFRPLEALSPELRNLRKTSASTDFYGIGLTTYYLLTAKKPRRNWNKPSLERPELNPGWDLLISHCMEPNPERRFPHQRAFQKDLEAVNELATKPVREGGRNLRLLARLPMPERIVELLGSRRLRVLRRGLLGIAVLLSLAAGWLLMQILMAEDVQEVSVRWVEMVPQAQANIILHIAPQRAWVEFPDSEGERFLVLDGTFWGRYLRTQGSIEVSAPGYRSKQLSFEIERGGAALEKWVNLEQNLIDLEFAGLPGTRIEMLDADGVPLYLGDVNEAGVLKLEGQLLAGEYRFRGSLAGYATWEVAGLQYTEGTHRLELQQAALPASLQLTGPEGAQVWIDGALVGTLPYESGPMTPQQRYAIEIRREGMRSVERSIALEPGENYRWRVGDLAAAVGRLSFELQWPEGESAPPQVEYRIGSEVHSDAGPHTVPEGDYSLEITAAGYAPVTTRVAVADGGNYQIRTAMQPIAPQLQIQLPEGKAYRLFKNGNAVEWDGVAALVLKAFEPVVIDLMVRDYAPSRLSWTPGAAQTRQWQPELTPLPGPEQGTDWNVPYIAIPFKWVAAGSFRMGSPLSEARRLPNEDNATRVELTRGFWVGQYEVRQRDYQRVMGSNPSEFAGELRPVESVTWAEAQQFCERLTAAEAAAGRLPAGYVYRLPSEAEWAFAARAGSTEAFQFGAQASALQGAFVGAYPATNAPPRIEDRAYGTVPTGQFAANGHGLYDVHGNVAEWTLDSYWDRLPGGSVVDYLRSGDGERRAVRGGSWQDSAHRVRFAARQGERADARRNWLGFRIVLAPALQR